MFCAFVMRFHLLRLLRWLLSSRVIYGERIQEHACLRRKAVFFVFMPIFKIFSSAGGGATALFTNKWFPFSFPFSSLNFPHSALNRELTKRRRRRRRKNLEEDFYSSLLHVGKPDMCFGRKRKKKVGGDKKYMGKQKLCWHHFAARNDTRFPTFARGARKLRNEKGATANRKLFPPSFLCLQRYNPTLPSVSHISSFSHPGLG